MRPWWAITALALVFGACGADEPDRFELRTPGSHPGEPVAAVPATPTPTPTASPKPVTQAEKRVIKGWSDTLRRGRVVAAARYFTVPAYISNNSAATNFQTLPTKAAVEEFNRTLNCGSKLLRTRRGPDGFVVGIFELTERKTKGDSCGAAIGETAAVAFQIQDDHILRWVQVDPDAAEPTPTPTPAGTPTTG